MKFWNRQENIFSKLLHGNLNDVELKMIRKQLKDYRNDVETIYDKLQLTINCHLIDRLVDNYKEHGPLAQYTAFFTDQWSVTI